MSNKESGCDRRQFVKRAAGAAAAIGTAGLTGQACAITYRNGKRVEWWCIIDVVSQHPTFWIYRWENCQTQQQVDEAGPPGLGAGDCGNPTATACLEDLIIDSRERVVVSDRVFLISPDLDAEARADFERKKRRIAVLLGQR